MRVATANIQCILDRNAASRALRVVLDTKPDVVLLQEWALKRLPVLREVGSVNVVPIRLDLGHGPYHWFAPITGGCVVGLSAARLTKPSACLLSLSLPGWSEGQLVQPGRTAVAVRAVDTANDGATVTAISYHLVPGAQHGTRYNLARPHQVRRHQQERNGLERAIRAARESGDQVFAGGDSNFVGFTLDGLTSLWSPQRESPNPIDDIFSLTQARDVTALSNESDHQAIVADFA